MVSSQMPIVKIEGTEAHVRNFLKDVAGRATKIVRDKDSTVYVAIPAQELGWIDKIARDTNVKKTEVHIFPMHEKAACGVFTTRLRYHTGRCKQCTALRPPKPCNSEVRTVVKVEGLHDLTLGGLVALMKGKMDEAMALAQEYDTVVKAIEMVPELQSQLGTLNKQIDEHRQALKYFMERK